MPEQGPEKEPIVPVFEAAGEIHLYTFSDDSFSLSSTLMPGERFTRTGPVVALTTPDQYNRPIPYGHMFYIQNGTKAGWARGVQILDAEQVN